MDLLFTKCLVQGGQCRSIARQKDQSTNGSVDTIDQFDPIVGIPGGLHATTTWSSAYSKAGIPWPSVLLVGIRERLRADVSDVGSDRLGDHPVQVSVTT